MATLDLVGAGETNWAAKQNTNLTNINNELIATTAKADTAYQKPGTGVPKTDLASAVQTSLGKADTALQPADVGTMAAENAADYLTADQTNAAIAGVVDSPGWRQLRRDLLARREALKGAPNLATRTAMGATLTGSDKWFGGVLGPDGKIYGIPYSATDILVIDPVAGTATRTAMGATLTGGDKWFGGVLGPDGKIYGIPYNATDILVIDPVAGTATRTAMGATLTGSYKWVGGVLGPDGKIYGIPSSATDILRTALPVPTPFAYSPYFNKM